MIEAFRNLIPLRPYFLTSLAFGVTATNLLTAYLLIDTPVDPERQPQALVPDVCIFGYTPYLILDWYQALEEHGTLWVYRVFAGVDLVFIIVGGYLPLFASHLVSRDAPTILCYLPLFMAMGDLIETCTIFVGTLYALPEAALTVANLGTIFKYGILSLLLPSVLYCSIRVNNPPTTTGMKKER